MVFDQIRSTGDYVVLRSQTTKRAFLIPAEESNSLAGPERLWSIERDIRDRFDVAARQVRPSMMMVHGVVVEAGTSSDYVVRNTYSNTLKAFLHACSRPELVGREFAKDLCSGDGGRVLLLSESTCLDVTVPMSTDMRTDLQVKNILVNDGTDFYGRIIDYVREQFGEDLKTTGGTKPRSRR